MAIPIPVKLFDTSLLDAPIKTSLLIPGVLWQASFIQVPLLVIPFLTTISSLLLTWLLVRLNMTLRRSLTSLVRCLLPILLGTRLGTDVVGALLLGEQANMLSSLNLTRLIKLTSLLRRLRALFGNLATKAA